MYMNEKADSECKKIIELYQEKIKNQKAENIPLLFKSFYDAVIDNKDILFEKISNIRNAKELAIYMRNGSFAEDALDDFAALMFASTINEEIISDYDKFVKQLYEIFKINNYKSDDFKQFTEAWSNKMIQKTMNDVNNRRLSIVEIGTGIGSETAKKFTVFYLEKQRKLRLQ